MAPRPLRPLSLCRRNMDATKPVDTRDAERRSVTLSVVFGPLTPGRGIKTTAASPTTVTNSFVEERCMPRMADATTTNRRLEFWWWPVDDGIDPNMFDVTVTYSTPPGAEPGRSENTMTTSTRRVQTLTRPGLGKQTTFEGHRALGELSVCVMQRRGQALRPPVQRRKDID